MRETDNSPYKDKDNLVARRMKPRHVRLASLKKNQV